jgi:hypothetical protein
MAKKNEIIDKTIDASGMDLPIEGFFMKEKRYGLTPLEHKILSDPESKLLEWSKNIFLISLGLAFNIAGKVLVFFIEFNNSAIEKRHEINVGTETWEFISLGIGLTLSLILQLLSHTKLDNSERKTLMKKIKKYFDGE